MAEWGIPNSLRMEEIPNKGYGLVARVDIPKGRRIICERPLFMINHRDVSREAHTSDAVDRVLAKIVASKLEKCSMDDQKEFLSLYSRPEISGNTLMRTYRTNALPLSRDSPEVGLFLVCARLNHSCCPNTQHTWHEFFRYLTVHAVKDIARGDEITISYVESIGTYARRKEKLLSFYGFECGCELCRLPEAEQKVHDKNLKKIIKMNIELDDSARIVVDPEGSLKAAYKLYRLLVKEGLNGALFLRVYNYALEIAAYHGDLARTKVFAKTVYDLRVMIAGAHDEFSIRMEDFVQHPTRHPSYWHTKRWQTKLKMIPKSLDESAFEAWLWRQDQR